MMRLLGSAVLAAVAGCLAPQVLRAQSEAGDALERITLSVVPPLGVEDSLEARKGVECLERALTRSYPHILLVPASQFREAIFPWFELETMPRDASSVTELLKRPPIVRRLGELKVRYLLITMMNDVAQKYAGPFICGGGLGGGGCLGFSTGIRETKIAVALWDLKTGDPVGSPFSAESKGTSWIAGFIIPFWHIAPTDENACADVAKQLGSVWAR